MKTVRASTKGQIVVPKDVRRRLGIGAGTVLGLSERRGALVLRPIRSAPGLSAIDAACGLLEGSGALKHLLEERRREREREKHPPSRSR